MASFLDRRRAQGRAGASAAAEYEKLKKDWHRRKRPLFAVLGAIAVVVVVSTLFAALPAVWPWSGGCASGLAVAFFVIARESPPAWIETYLVGSVGEERTAKVRHPLPSRAGPSFTM